MRDVAVARLLERIDEQVADHLGMAEGVGGADFGPSCPVGIDEGDSRAQRSVDGKDHDSRLAVVTLGKRSAPARAAYQPSGARRG
jgi:hypothetical protein